MWDTRTAFSKPTKDEPYEHATMMYNTYFKLQTPTNQILSKEMNMPSVTFSPDGKYFGAINQSWFPTVYETKNQAPLVLLRSRPDMTVLREYADEGFRSLVSDGYRSHSTIKTGEWSNYGGNLTFWSGSEDFNVYGWSIPGDNSWRKYDDCAISILV